MPREHKTMEEINAAYDKLILDSTKKESLLSRFIQHFVNWLCIICLPLSICAIFIEPVHEKVNQVRHYYEGRSSGNSYSGSRSSASVPANRTYTREEIIKAIKFGFDSAIVKLTEKEKAIRINVLTAQFLDSINK